MGGGQGREKVKKDQGRRKRERGEGYIQQNQWNEKTGKWEKEEKKKVKEDSEGVGKMKE